MNIKSTFKNLDLSNIKHKASIAKEKRKKKECMTRTSRVVPHHSTNLARCRLTSMCGMGIGAIGMKCTHSREDANFNYIYYERYNRFD